MGWQTVQRLTEMRRWAEASASAVAPLNMKSTNAKLKWTLLWVITHMQSALSVVRLDICHDPALIIPKDFMHKEVAVMFVAQWNIFRRTVQSTRLQIIM